jgi:hypothetical protein
MGVVTGDETVEFMRDISEGIRALRWLRREHRKVWLSVSIQSDYSGATAPEFHRLLLRVWLAFYASTREASPELVSHLTG